MKKSFGILAATIASSFFLISCDKEGNEIEDEKIQTERIEDIIPQQYLDSLAKLDFKINKGIKPPTINGKFSIKPHKLSKSNIPNDPIGHVFSDAVVSLFGQNDKDFSIKLLGENFINLRDTSISTAISGSGNDFTIYGKVKSNRGEAYGISALLISGSLEGDHLKNVQTGIIMVDASHGDALMIKEGQARVAFDSDFISERMGEVESKAQRIRIIKNTKTTSTTLGQQISSY